MITTFGQLKASRTPQALGYCADSPKFAATANEAMQRLLSRGKWVGTYGRFSIAITAGNITWPRQIGTIEGLDVCCQSVPLRNEWFEFVQTGPGLADENHCRCARQLQDKGTSPLITDLTGEKQIKVYIDNPIDVGKTIWFKAKDVNGNRIYQDSGEEGFPVVLASPFVLDTTVVTEVYGVIKDETVGAVRVYQYTTIGAIQSLIAVYEPSETTPCYRRSYLTGLPNDPDMTITAFAKLAFIPVKFDTDFLIIPNIPAVKEMCVAVKMAECEKWAEAEAAEARAKRELDTELSEFLGDSSQPSIHVQNAAKDGCPVWNPI